MDAKKRDFFVYVPKQLVELEIDIDSKTGILMAYCWIKRYASIDGKYSTNIRQIMIEYGLHYDETKTKMLPKQMIYFKNGMDYLLKNNYLRLLKGGYATLDDFFSVEILNDNQAKNFVCLRYSSFDYIMQSQKRINKMNLLYVLLFILSCHNTMIKNEKKEAFCVCSYSLEWLSKKLGFSTLSIHKYLKNLSTNQNHPGIEPLVKSKIWCVKIGERIIRFPSIYVENKENASELIEYQRNCIRRKFQNEDTSNDFEHYLDNSNYHDLF